MKRIILTILVLGLCGLLIALPEHSAVSYGSKTATCPCTTFIVDTVYLPSDSLFKMKWDAFDALLDSILEEMSREKR